MSLEALLKQLERCAPAERIDLRNDVLAHGEACIDPLLDLAERKPDLGASAAAWIEALAVRAPETKTACVAGLRRLAKGPNGQYAVAALERLGAPAAASSPRSGAGPKGPSAAQDAVHARIIKAAREGRLITYGELETNRGHVGKFLFNISQAEAELGHPPLSAIVISVTDGMPGDGFLPAMLEIGYAHPGETLEPVWKRAVRDVHTFWQSADAPAGIE